MAATFWSLTVGGIKWKFPDVRNLNTREVDEMMKSDRAVILDVRPEIEYEVSHIEGAVRVDPDLKNWQELSQIIREIEKYQQCVCYCSVGYRSSALVSRLQQQMQDEHNCKLFNMEGSLFKWANEGRPMVNAKGEPTVKAHPYSLLWGKLLKSELREWNP
eukprot:m.1092 g.1092  ORF g.1092 m.1092 type:complete len:160 (+) comp5662_c0_seq2:12-491(+)